MKRKTSIMKNKKTQGLASLVAISPFAALVVGLLNPRDQASRNLVWVFVIFYGAVFYLPDWSGSDSVRYLAQLKWMYWSDFTLDDLMHSIYLRQDVYQPVITFLISRFTDQAWVLFGVFGILLGYVYSRNIWFLIDRVGNRQSAVIVFLIIAFAMDVSIGSGINGVRFWTACHVFVFGILYFSDGRNRKYLFVALLTPLIHFSFILPCALLLLFFAVKRFGTAIYVFFVASFLVSQLDLAVVKSIMQYLPFSFEDRAMAYVNEVDSGGRYGANEKAWFIALNGQLTALFILIVSTYMYWRGVHRIHSKAGGIFVFGMLIYGATNLVSYVPAASRFFSVGELLIIAALVLFLGTDRIRKKDMQLAGAMSSLLVINTALGARKVLEFTSVYLLFGNFFVAPFVEADVGLYELIKGLL
ncbi:MAG: hypothetical protein OEU40_16090 [Gammaproteobacteria bacterium]|nr:hypothetical protein [Gammaproteobacteria bacterium]